MLIMGCDYYNLENGYVAHFSEIELCENGCDCLCTFPHNYVQKRLNKFDVESLAVLGAALVLSHQNELNSDYVHLPNSLDKWIFDEIQRILETDKIRQQIKDYQKDGYDWEWKDLEDFGV